MKLDEKDAQYFFDLETSLHKSEIRKSPEATGALLADGFVEFGSSGRIWSKASVVESMRREEPQVREIIVEDFVAEELAPNVVLVTYTSRTSTVTRSTLRSSIWKRIATKWQMVFHQGTPSSRAGAVEAQRMAIEFKCPQCGAEPYELCRWRNGQRKERSHVKRIDLTFSTKARREDGNQAPDCPKNTKPRKRL